MATLSNSAASKPLQWLADLGAAVVLLGMLAGVFALDSQPQPVTPPPAEIVPEPEPEPEPPPPPPEIIPPAESVEPVDPQPRIAVRHSEDYRIGVQTTSGNPDDPDDDNKKLTYSVDGGTSNTRVHVDGATPLFGGSEGTVLEHTEDLPRQSETVWSFRDVAVTQQLELIPGDVSRRMDGIRVTYSLENRGQASHQVGLRVMIDTLIGGNDGVPFIVPGINGIVTEAVTFEGDDIPDFVRALEKGDLANPGVIVDIGLREQGQNERPTRVTLTHWPGSSAAWDYNRSTPFGSDSAAGIYYAIRKLDPGQKRSISFRYGLGSISSTRTRNAKLSLTAGGPFRAGGKFWVVALVQHPQDGQKVTLKLPAGLTLEQDDAAEKTVQAGGDFTQLSWLVNVDNGTVGNVELAASLTPEDVEERQAITVQPRDAKLTLVAKGPVEANKPFWVAALVQNPKPGQTLELKVPKGLRLAKGQAARQDVKIGQAYSQVAWLLQSDSRKPGEFRLEAQLSPDGLGESCTVEVRAGTLID